MILNRIAPKMVAAKKFPTIFLNHGGGPLPLLGLQPDITEHIRYVRTEILEKRYPQPPKAIVVVSAHYEHDIIQITSSVKPPMLYDYYGFPPEAYQFQYQAPGSPELANQIRQLLQEQRIPCECNDQRGYDHGVFIPLSLLYPEANIPVVCVSLRSGLDSAIHIRLGQALEPLREQEILIIGSGYTFHNMKGFRNPSHRLLESSKKFDDWLQKVMLHSASYHDMIQSLILWEKQSSPYGRECHPREEHLLPLFVMAAAGGENAKAKLINEKLAPIAASMDATTTNMIFTQYAVSSFMFE